MGFLKTKQKEVVFHVGWDSNSNIIAMPFESAFIYGDCRMGKSMLVHRLISQSLLDYTPDDIEFVLWGLKDEYEIWKVGEVGNGKVREVGNVKVYDTTLPDGATVLEGIEEIADKFISEIEYCIEGRLNAIKLSGCKDYSEYCYEHPEVSMPRRVYVMDSLCQYPGTGFIERISEIINKSNEVGVCLFLVSNYIWKYCDFAKTFDNLIVFNCKEKDSEGLLGSNIAQRVLSGKSGVFLFKRKNSDEIMKLSNPIISYSMIKKYARALSKEVKH